jgi:hypothetical protein
MITETHPISSVWKNPQGDSFRIVGHGLNDSIIYTKVGSAEFDDFNPIVESRIFCSVALDDWQSYTLEEEWDSLLELELDDDILLSIAKRAHEEDVTFNKMVEHLIRSAIQNSEEASDSTS